MVGREVDDYHITAELGSGGMGTVYLATDTKLRRTVALKFLAHSYTADDEMKRRFVREAQAAASLNHPNIVPIYAVAEFEGRPYFAMEWVDGQPLSMLLSAGRLAGAQILEISIQICEALVAAHEAGLIHRDIKPANILLDRSGRVRLVDFGLARRTSDVHVTPADTTLGTLAYSSPELLRGEEPGPASDLFSVGTVLYQMITGRLPFTGRYEAAVTHAIVHVPPPPIHVTRQGVHRRLPAVAMKLLEKDTASRYQSARDVLTDLQSIRRGAMPSGPKSRVATRTRRFIMYTVAVFLLLTVLFVGSRFVPPIAGDKVTAHRTIAVLPFENLGPAEDEYLADGITNAVTMHLATFGELSVISLSSSMQYKQSTKRVPQIAMELGADYLLKGTVQWDRSGEWGQGRISAALVDAEDGSYIWSNTYTPQPVEIFSLQEELGQRVARALKIAVRNAHRASSAAQGTRDLEAYDLYLRGSDYFNRSEKQDDLEIAIDLFTRAATRDSGFAAAFAMLSRGQCTMYSDNYDRSADRLRLAEDAARKARALDPDLPEAHLAMGYCHYAAHDYDGALREFALVRDIQPNNRYLYNAIGAVYRRQGNLHAAVQQFVKALELDPRSQLRAMDVGLTYGLLQDYERAEEYIDRAIILAPDWPLPYLYKAWIPILRDGDVARAREIFSRAVDIADLRSSPYYCQIARIVEPSFEVALENAKHGGDPVGYYLHCAQLSRLMGQYAAEQEFADSARRRLLAQGDELTGQAWYHSRLALALAGLRLHDEALQHAQRSVELWETLTDPIDAPFLIANCAEVCVILNEFDMAVAQIEQLADIPGFATPASLRVDPLWDRLHSHPKFKSLIADQPG